MSYPELFWRRYTGLGSQTQTHKLSKVLISGVSFRHRSFSQSHESNVLSYSECKIAEIFQGFAPGPHWVATPLGSPTAQRFFSLRLSKNSPQKYCWIRHWIYIFLKTTMWYGLDFMFNVFRLMVWKLIIVSKNTQQWSLLPFFFFFFCYSPMLIIKVEKSLEGKAKI